MNLPRLTRKETADYVLSALKKSGFPPRPGSRIQQMCDIYLQKQTSDPEDEGFETAIEAERDMQLLHFIFEQSLRDSKRKDDVLKKLNNDSVLPQKNLQNSFGRDAQFELYVGAICQAAGFENIRFDEPDITCLVGPTKVGFAAKRVKSEQRLNARIKKAAKQINSSNLSGIVVIDTSLMLNPENERIWNQMSENVFWNRYKQVFNEYLDEKRKEIIRRVKKYSNNNTVGIVFHDHQVRLRPDEEWELASLSHFIPIESIAGIELSYSVWNSYKHALPNEINLNKKLPEIWTP